MKYFISKEVKLDFESAEKKVLEELGKQGFGILTQIDIQEKLKEKLDVNFRKYKILGACNPPYAYKALQLEDQIGLMLPCNIVLQEHVSGIVEVSAVDPIASMLAVENPNLESIAKEIKAKLELVIKSV
ncbi:DUF302 domain-containing protein [Ancylomarina longa]|uniref:DUF302 domain-containing protein n=1 Tax=Ancylomarina longa TaxID=2487017 RepID=A0A434AYG1_9BACT|nr:DUF302 domain-containing protein [Ancylomarina longa]RUT79601.1 DUF302 domain-containing protein [Ancylomarina longa]